MTDKTERHFCINCERELTEEEAFFTISGGCRFCGATKGFITLSDGLEPIKLSDDYLDNYLTFLKQREKLLWPED